MQLPANIVPSLPSCHGLLFYPFIILQTIPSFAGAGVEGTMWERRRRLVAARCKGKTADDVRDTKQAPQARNTFLTDILIMPIAITTVLYLGARLRA